MDAHDERADGSEGRPLWEVKLRILLSASRALGAGESEAIRAWTELPHELEACILTQMTLPDLARLATSHRAIARTMGSRNPALLRAAVWTSCWLRLLEQRQMPDDTPAGTYFRQAFPAVGLALREHHAASCRRLFVRVLTDAAAADAGPAAQRALEQFTLTCCESDPDVDGRTASTGLGCVAVEAALVHGALATFRRVWNFVHRIVRKWSYLRDAMVSREPLLRCLATCMRVLRKACGPPEGETESWICLGEMCILYVHLYCSRHAEAPTPSLPRGPDPLPELRAFAPLLKRARKFLADDALEAVLVLVSGWALDRFRGSGSAKGEGPVNEADRRAELLAVVRAMLEQCLRTDGYRPGFFDAAWRLTRSTGTIPSADPTGGVERGACHDTEEEKEKATTDTEKRMAECMDAALALTWARMWRPERESGLAAALLRRRCEALGVGGPPGLELCVGPMLGSIGGREFLVPAPHRIPRRPTCAAFELVDPAQLTARERFLLVDMYLRFVMRDDPATSSVAQNLASLLCHCIKS